MAPVGCCVAWYVLLFFGGFLDVFGHVGLSFLLCCFLVLLLLFFFLFLLLGVLIFCLRCFGCVDFTIILYQNMYILKYVSGKVIWVVCVKKRQLPTVC